MTDNEAKLLQILKERSFKKGTFRLASGDESNYFIDGKMSQVFSESAYLIGQVLYDHTSSLPIDAIGGLEVGAVPMTAATVIAYHLHGRKLEGFWVRDEVKDHGTKKRIEGGLKPGSSVVIIDDVFTRGNSAMKAAKAVREIGCKVVQVLALVDRLQGAPELFAAADIPYGAVFTIRDFGID